MSEPKDMWAVLELMGHVRLAGHVTEEEHFGGKLGRIDVPNKNGGFTTQFFNASSIYRLTPTSEEVARNVALNCQPSPVHSWEMPKPAMTHVPDPCFSAADVDIDDDREREDDDFDV